MNHWAIKYNDELKPIHHKVMKKIYGDTAAFIFATDKTHAICSACDSEFEIIKTKHKQKYKCPVCKRTLQMQHTWRMSQYLENIAWKVIPTVINANTLVLRYILGYTWQTKHTVQEVGRWYCSTEYAAPDVYTLHAKGHWISGKGTYFRTPSYMMRNRFFCMYADEYDMNKWYAEINKLDCFKYYPVDKIYSTKRLASQMHYLMQSASLNEKLTKLNLAKSVDSHYNYYRYHKDRVMKNINYKATSLKDMLKLNAKKFEIFRQQDTLDILPFLQSHTDAECDEFVSTGCSVFVWKTIHDIVDQHHVSFRKVAKYINDKGLNSLEYKHYITTCTAVYGRNLDSYYLFPRDFKQADKTVTELYQAEMQKIALAELSVKDALVKQISDGLKAMPNLQDYLNGSRGFIVYIPESYGELKAEGIAQNNCVATYLDRIAAGKTLVFYIRQLDNPTASFVTMEYCHGRVIQARLNHNVEVPNGNVRDFINDFASTLRESGVLVA